MSEQPNLVALKTNNSKYSSDVASLFLSLEAEIKWGFFFPPTVLFDVVLSSPTITLGDSLHSEQGLDKTKYLILMHFFHIQIKKCRKY